MNMDPMFKWELLTTELNEAFNDFPESTGEGDPATTTATEAAMEEQSFNVEIISRCSHPCPPELLSKPFSRKLCPSCLIDDHISDIRAIKIAFERRGGIFDSKTHLALPKNLRHKDYVKMWTVAKIECYRDVELLEKLRDNDPKQAKESGVLEALERWEQAREKSHRVPGYKYVDDQVEELESETEPAEELDPGPAPESVPVADNEPDVEIGTSRPATPEGLGALLVEDREYHVVIAKPKRKKRRNVNLTVSTESAINDIFMTKPGDLAGSNDEVLQEMGGVAKRLNRRLSMGKWDLSDAINGSVTTALQNSADQSDPPPTPPLTPITPKTVALPSTPTQRSALKGSRLCPLSDRTTFSSKKSIMTPGSIPSIEEAHNKHTNADDARMRGNFHRTSPCYRKGSWASSDDFEKEDTSFMRMTWFRFEKYVRAPPPVKQKMAWMKSMESTAKRNFQSEMKDAIDEMRDAKRKRDIPNAIDDMQEDSEEKVQTNASSDMRENDTEQEADAATREQKSKPTDMISALWTFKGKDLSMHDSHLLVKRRVSRFEELQELGSDEREDYMGQSHASETSERMQLEFHSTTRKDFAATPSAITETSDDSQNPIYASMQEYTWPLHMPLRPRSYRMVASDENRAPASPKPVHRDLRRSSKQLVQEGLTLGVGERESER
jgi:hypothetical protein